MSMRELVTGGAACAVPGSSSSSNPLGALANALIGSSSKTQGVLKEIPNTSAAPQSQFYSQADPVAALPGSELERPFFPSNAQGSEFIRGFRTGEANGLADAWDEIQRQPQLDHGYGAAAPAPPTQHTLDGPPQRVLSSFLHSFVDSSRSGIPLHPTPLPLLGLSQGDKQCIRDRSSIMARHIFADKSEEFINAQVTALLSSLEIENDIHARGPMPGRFRELESYWNESQGPPMPGAHAADGWVTEFSQNRMHHGDPNAWAHSFEQQHGAGGWASEFEQEQAQLASVNQMGGGNIGNLAAMQQTRMLAHTLSQNGDPKFQNSKFLQFVSKMSRGELIIDDNQVKPASENWATEYQQQYNRGASWADEFAETEVFRGPDQWANEFAAERLQQEPVDDQWVNEFSKLHVDDDWAEEFGRQVGEGALGDSSSDNWANAYDEFLNEQLAVKQRSDASRGVYVFSDMNPYVGHPNPLKEGQELFRKGLLSEAVLALEAEVMKNADNAEAWRLLGITHAENDDDQQAIAAMMRAHEADPTNLEVLLALGVSHTNEMEMSAAINYLYGWLRHHPKYGNLAPPELANSLYYADVARSFNEAAQMSPEDADVHIVLGVLYNLSREYDKAITSFKTALKLKPNDYSLWNKLGATQANSVQSADAILAYQQALDLKPNYVRAWANMGISYANQGMYEESIRYYVRALAMNPKADNAWQYLRISLSSASRNDMIEACDSRNLALLQKEFPLFDNNQRAAKQRSDALRGVYVFSDMNPYGDHPNPLKQGQELFVKGLLSEAVLVLEAEIIKNSKNAQGWRLLGITHAENDDDQQAIAAMVRAHEADPTNLEILLALGVSHTNELEQSVALNYLYGWLCHHPKYYTLARPELTDAFYYADLSALVIVRIFDEAARMFPDDADVHIVLGVLCNLSRGYEKAIASFKTALKLKPNDYTLWNKLGATQANSKQSADAILAYQQALKLRPNYVRALANMGISYANQAMYEESIRYYVRALVMNPKADHTWQYLRLSLSSASRNDMLEACDSRNLELLQKEFSL